MMISPSRESGFITFQKIVLRFCIFYGQAPVLLYRINLLLMSTEKAKNLSFKDFGPQQIFAGLVTGFSVTPINTIVDKSIIENANGKRPLWSGVAHGLKNMVFHPRIFFTAYEFKWILAVYHATFVTSNLADHYVIPWLDPAISKLLAVFAVNTTMSLLKDKALTQRFGNGEVRKFPFSALNLFFLRDIIAMASAFTLPPIIGKYIEEKWKMSEKASLRLAQMTCPVLVQLVATPIHLLGLDLYNRTGISMSQRMGHLKKIYTHSVILRMLRFLPAYGIGGVVNMELRKYLLHKDHY